MSGKRQWKTRLIKEKFIWPQFLARLLKTVNIWIFQEDKCILAKDMFAGETSITRAGYSRYQLAKMSLLLYLKRLFLARQS